MFLYWAVRVGREKGERMMCKWIAAPSAPCLSIGGQRALLAQMTVAEVTGVALTDLCGDKRGGPKAAFARQTAMYLCHLVFAMNFADIARAFGRDRTTIRHALRRIEEAREQSEFDRSLQWLEAALRRAGGGDG
jgi:hypothetical protein